jgi:hypothetical protein
VHAPFCPSLPLIHSLYDMWMHAHTHTHAHTYTPILCYTFSPLFTTTSAQRMLGFLLFTRLIALKIYFPCYSHG